MERKRRRETKERILEEACHVFAEKGYRDATHAEICGASQTNIAAINYYFDSKEALYRAAFEHLAGKAEEAYPLHGNLPATARPEKRLRAFIHGLLSRMFDPGPLGYLHAIRMAERFTPTGLLDDSFERWLARDRGNILAILRDFLGPGAAERDILWAEMSIIGQCMIGLHDTDERGPRKLFQIDASDLERLTEHIYQFSLGGIKAIRRRIEAPGN
ncbi:MAG: CerR family C-terminal domain-containing protein [Candidatus Hydrogenedentes bacterium]|nr:CerR family C-terminal domain-containing protein [Candidatus Hydrogenedentota bacterium]